MILRQRHLLPQHCVLVLSFVELYILENLLTELLE